jgi:two-component system, LytTR family, sensor kinase
MKVQLPQYSGKDNLVMIAFVPSFALCINCLIFGAAYFTHWSIFLGATIISSLYFAVDFILCGLVAVFMKHRFPQEKDLMKRLTIMILIFLVITGLFLYCLFLTYEVLPFFNQPFSESAFTWAYFSMGIINVFLTFLMEGISRYQDWKRNWEETEKLKKTYKQSQLQGLKSQVNQHFLFNSLNSLSSLIQEDEEKAEEFLNEMSRVYRYMLRMDEEQMVTLETELKFIRSYRHLLKARYGAGLELEIDVSEEDLGKWLPPLTLQVIVENAFSHNAVSKESPLVITISSQGYNNIKVSNNVQPKIITTALDNDTAMDNLVNKYALLIDSPLRIDETSAARDIYLPLLINKEKEEELA